jgi:hypothetical protein
MKGNAKSTRDDPGTAMPTRERSRISKATYSGGVAIFVATAAIGLAACGGPSSPTAGVGTSSPTVASLANPGRSESDGSSTTAPSTGNPIHLLNEWAVCMRKHGDPDQAEPIIDASKLIHITILPSVPGGLLGPNSQSGPGPVPASYCQAFLLGAINALRGNQEFQPPSQAGLLKYAECMRANGVPDYPDPFGGGLQIHRSPEGDLDPNNPTFVQAGNICAKKTGVHVPSGGGPLPAGTVVSGPPGQPGTPDLIYFGNGPVGVGG